MCRVCVCRVCVCRVCGVTNRVTGQNLRTVIGISLLFFWKLRITEKKYRAEKEIEKGVKKRCEIAKKRCQIANLEEFSTENLCKPYILLWQLGRRIIWWKKNWKRCEKKVLNRQKGVKSLIWRNFQQKTYVNHIYILVATIR